MLLLPVKLPIIVVTNNIIVMKRLSLLFFVVSLFASSLSVYAQKDPEIMKINGKSISKSEFEYFYSKNFTGVESTNETLKEYADLFINYKMKVEAAEAAGIDKTKSFLDEFKQYRDILAESYLIDSVYLESVARETFRMSAEDVGPDGIILLNVISVVPKGDSDEDIQAAKLRIDSIYGLLSNKENFGRVAEAFSDDASASDGGTIGWVSKVQLDPSMADYAFSMKEGEMSMPFFCDAGYLILYVTGKKDFGDYNDHRDDIYRWMQEQGIYEESKEKKAEKISKDMGWNLSGKDALVRVDSLLEELNPEFRNISREYYDGLLLFEISNREVWEKASKDSLELVKYFDAHKTDYKFVAPRFKGMLFFCTSEQVYNDIKSLLKDVPMKDWPDKIAELNKSSVVVKVISGPVEKGKLGFVDKYVFGEGEAKSIEGYPYVNYLGYVTDSPEEYQEVASSVVNDYQNQLENQWIKSLRKKYHYKINKKVLFSVMP
jgi:peptidyl-prolyl cis-trans isomerase SurA